MYWAQKSFFLFYVKISKTKADISIRLVIDILSINKSEIENPNSEIITISPLQACVCCFPGVLISWPLHKI
jgi:hypothetical protein